MSEYKQKNTKKSVEVSVDSMMDGARNLVEKGNQRRFVLRSNGGNTILDVPLTIAAGAGLLGLFFFQFWFFIAVIAAIVFKVQIEVARVDAGLDEAAELSVDLEDAADRISSRVREATQKMSAAADRIKEESQKSKNED